MRALRSSPGRRDKTWIGVFLGLGWGFWLGVGLAAAAQLPGPPLDAATQARLAEQFAPILVYHPDEEYFPTSPLFLLDGRRSAALEGSDPVSSLGTTESRESAYRALSTPEKEALARVYYRAYPSQRRGEPVIVLEYWMYYVRNEYRLHANILPVWYNGNHPNDLEHIHIVLGGDGAGLQPAGAGPAAAPPPVEEILASAHEGTMPANRYRFDGAGEGGSRRFIVELGSHAAAPDIDEDGVYTPGRDGDSGQKVLWGIRDHGALWHRYRPGYMDARGEGEEIVFEHTASGDGALTYRLAPVTDLESEIAGLGLDEAQRKQVFETDIHWFRRAFGGDNGSSARLLVPPPIDSESIGIQSPSASERGFLVGGDFTQPPGLFLSGRYGFLNSRWYLPDLILQAEGVVARESSYFSPQFLLSYPVDGMLRFMGGPALVTDSIRFDRRKWDWVAGIEARLGPMRVYVGLRTVNPMVKRPKEVRLSYFF